MLEKFINTIKLVRDNVEPGSYSVDIGVTVEEVLPLIRLTGYTSITPMDGEYGKWNLVKIGPHINLYVQVDPLELPNIPTPELLKDPVAAASLVHGVLGIDKFTTALSQVSVFDLTDERAHELAAKINPEFKRKEYDYTRWLSCGTANVFLV